MGVKIRRFRVLKVKMAGILAFNENDVTHVKKQSEIFYKRCR